MNKYFSFRKGYVQYIHDKENNHEGTGDTEMQENKT